MKTAFCLVIEFWNSPIISAFLNLHSGKLGDFFMRKLAVYAQLQARNLIPMNLAPGVILNFIRRSSWAEKWENKNVVEIGNISMLLKLLEFAPIEFASQVLIRQFTLECETSIGYTDIENFYCKGRNNNYSLEALSFIFK